MAIPKFIVKFIGDVFIHKFPFYIIYKPNIHKLKGYQVRKVINELKLGDVLYRRYDGYLSTKFIPGFWSHVGLYIGDNKVIHAVGRGVVEEDILDFCRTDHIGIARLNIKDSEKIKAVALAKANVAKHTGYDYAYRSGNNKLYCSELVNLVYNNRYNLAYRLYYKKLVLTPQAMYNFDKKSLILEFRNI